MPRTARVTPGGMVFHVLNRGVGRMKLFRSDADYQAFEGILEETLALVPMRVCSYCLMPNHWHFVLWPKADGDLAAFMQRLTITHATRWQRHKQQVGYGHVYQGRFKSFPIATDESFHQVARYVERNALRAHLVERAEQWRWSSLWRREYGTPEQQGYLAAWPLAIPSQWLKIVNRPETEAELKALRNSVNRGQPYGPESWRERCVAKLGLESTMRPRGRPRKAD
ncbi:MAG: transposase [Planctomycetes bacterium]|nr:transposase [Planctomycetota bacterium]